MYFEADGYGDGMRFAADLHLHSRFASGVSPAMTVEAIARWAQRKGIDLLATGDCLQADWLRELEASLEEAEPGWFALKPEIAERVSRTLPAGLRRDLRDALRHAVTQRRNGDAVRRGKIDQPAMVSFLKRFPRANAIDTNHEVTDELAVGADAENAGIGAAASQSGSAQKVDNFDRVAHGNVVPPITRIIFLNSDFVYKDFQPVLGLRFN